jgi:hypothetical protein
MMRTILIFLMLSVSSPLSAQVMDKGFPRPLLPNKEETIETINDTLWILTDTQFKKSIEMAKKQKIDSSLVVNLEQKINMLNEICTEKDSLIAINRSSYFHYRDLWEKIDRKLEQAEIKNAGRWKLALSGFCVGIGFTSLIFMLIDK